MNNKRHFVRMMIRYFLINPWTRSGRAANRAARYNVEWP